jgi:hypothetical protein
METNTKKQNRRYILVLFGIMLLLFILPFIYAVGGVGIKWDKESVIVNEGEKTCMSYSIYNPWPEDSYVTIELSSTLKNVSTEYESEKKLIPANTPSTDAIPVKFCFKIPKKVYKTDCLLAGCAVCEQKCDEEQKVYSGEVLAKIVPAPSSIGGTAGSTTEMSVSAPLKIKISCNKHARNYTLIYLFIAGLSAVVVGALLYRKYRTPVSERDKEKLRKLQEKIRKETKKN